MPEVQVSMKKIKKRKVKIQNNKKIPTTMMIILKYQFMYQEVELQNGCALIFL